MLCIVTLFTGCSEPKDEITTTPGDELPAAKEPLKEFHPVEYLITELRSAPMLAQKNHPNGWNFAADFPVMVRVSGEKIALNVTAARLKLAPIYCMFRGRSSHARVVTPTISMIWIYSQAPLSLVESSITLPPGIVPQPVTGKNAGIALVVMGIRRSPAIIPIMSLIVNNVIKITSTLIKRL